MYCMRHYCCRTNRERHGAKLPIYKVRCDLLVPNICQVLWDGQPSHCHLQSVVVRFCLTSRIIKINCYFKIDTIFINCRQIHMHVQNYRQHCIFNFLKLPEILYFALIEFLYSLWTAFFQHP